MIGVFSLMEIINFSSSEKRKNKYNKKDEINYDDNRMCGMD